MALFPCPECNHNISDMAFSCPNCGYPLKEPLSIPSTRKPKRRRKLPNGSGSIKHLSGKRTKSWAAYPPTTEFSLSGSPILKPAIGYFATYNEAYQALMVYTNAPEELKKSSVSFADLCAAMLSNRSTSISPTQQKLTFSQVYDAYFDAKYNQSKKKLSSASINSTKAAYKNCKVLHDRKFVDLRKADLQSVVDSCTLKHSSLELIVSLFKGMYSYAIENDLIEKDYSKFVSINIADDDESGVPFSETALKILWQNKEHKGVGMILLMAYTGFRISAFKNIQYDQAGQFFQGGVKTAAGKNRIVPIHPAIQEFARNFVEKYSTKEKFTSAKCRSEFYNTLETFGITMSDAGTKHTPHDCRHTFSWLCDKYNVDTLSKHLLMGHSLGNDVECSVYGHRTLDELRAEIEKIKVPDTWINGS